MNVKKTIKLAREFTLFVVSIVTHMYTCTHVEGENCVGTTHVTDCTQFTRTHPLSHFHFHTLARPSSILIAFVAVLAK
jgi:hypothetical protein